MFVTVTRKQLDDKYSKEERGSHWRKPSFDMDTAPQQRELQGPGDRKGRDPGQEISRTKASAKIAMSVHGLPASVHRVSRPGSTISHGQNKQ